MTWLMLVFAKCYSGGRYSHTLLFLGWKSPVLDVDDG